jgi:hypothetical protein
LSVSIATHLTPPRLNPQGWCLDSIGVIPASPPSQGGGSTGNAQKHSGSFRALVLSSLVISVVVGA